LLNFFLRRLAATVPLLLVISFLTFLLLNSSSGDYLTRLLDNPSVTEEYVASLRAQYGLDRPFIERYGLWLWNAVQGNLGRSFEYNRDVSDLLFERMSNTLLLAFCALVLSWGVAIPLGVISAVRQNTWVDKVAGFIAYFGLSIPRVFLALLAVMFAASTGWFPIGGLRDEVHWDDFTMWEKTLDVAWHLFLPAMVLAITNMAGYMRQMRGYTIETLAQDYVRTARAKGLPESVVLFKHTVRNAINPLVTLFGYSLAYLITGSFLVEIVMSWPGMARLTLSALLAKDVHLVMASVMMASVMLVLGNLTADVLLAMVDPRIRVD
jgi:peptide/nickel transport system permease protein